MSDINKAFEQLANGGINYKEVVLALADKYPEVFCELVEAVGIKSDKWKEECKKIYQSNSSYGLVRAVKFWREQTRDSLKDSKASVEALVGIVRDANGFRIEGRNDE